MEFKFKLVKGDVRLKGIYFKFFKIEDEAFVL